MRRYDKLLLYMTRLSIVSVMLAAILPIAIDAQEVDATNDGIGIQILLSGAVQPIVQHTPANRSRLTVPVAFGIELDGLYRLPIAAVDLDVGIGVRYLFNRAVNNSEYGFVPLYALVHFPLTVPTLEDILSLYIDGRVGYSFFLPSQAYVNEYELDDEAVGGLYFGFGLGVIYNINRFLQIRGSALYHRNSVATGSGVVIPDTLFEILFGVGISF